MSIKKIEEIQEHQPSAAGLCSLPARLLGLVYLQNINITNFVCI